MMFQPPAFLNHIFQRSFGTLLLISLTAFFQDFRAQNAPDACRMINVLQRRMQQLHYAPVADDPKIHAEMLQLFVDEIDADGLLFSIQQRDSLQQLTRDNGLCFGYKATRNLYRKNLRTLLVQQDQILSKPLVFKNGQEFVYNENGSQHLRPTAEKQALYREFSLKHDLLRDVWDVFRKDSLKPRQWTKALDEEVRMNYRENDWQNLKRYIDDSMNVENELLYAFLDAVARRYDPHSGFFTYGEKKQFEAELSEERLVFGLDFVEDKERNIRIGSVLPGSPAWKSNAIFEGDLLVAIVDHKGKRSAMEGQGITGLSTVLDQPGMNKASFVLRNKAGIEQTVALVKAKVENAENAFTGFIFGAPGERVGYLALPSFYTDFESDAQLGCANDVAREILLMKKDSIRGLIIDLRNNGGGSLKEAIELSGLFINEGPMAVYQGKGVKPQLLKDLNRGTIYDGPLVILINSMSASASEFFAGCMQDYKRALIIGDRSYGKGTAQSIYPLDTVWTRRNDGFIKVTDGRFYQVSARSNQEHGIRPDLELPDVYTRLSAYREDQQAYHLPNDSVKKKVLYEPFKAAFTPDMLGRAQQRIAASDWYQQTQVKAAALSDLVQNDIRVPLDFDGFLRHAEKEDQQWKSIREERKDQQLMAVSNHRFNDKMFAFDADKRRWNDERRKQLENDFILFETYRLFQELFKFGQ